VRTTQQLPVVFLAAVLFSAGCATPPEPRELAGTSWRLVQQGVTAVPDPAKFTLAFQDGDQAAFLLDCNRGRSTYTAEPSADGQEGSLSFGPIAATKMACPPPSLDQEVSTALENVRGYRFIGERLHLSLQADGGVLTFEPA
jgi:heat shock protein HslJ